MLLPHPRVPTEITDRLSHHLATPFHLRFGAARLRQQLEGILREAFTFDKINYLLLMMVDKHVHFHIIPRYADARTACGVEFIDTAWPKPPDVTQAVDLTDKQFAELLRLLRASWPQ